MIFNSSILNMFEYINKKYYFIESEKIENERCNSEFR